MSQFYTHRAVPSIILQVLEGRTLTRRQLQDAVREIDGIEANDCLGSTNFLGLKDGSPEFKKRSDWKRSGYKNHASPESFPLQFLLNEGKVIWVSPPDSRTGELYSWDQHPHIPAKDRPTTGGFRLVC